MTCYEIYVCDGCGVEARSPHVFGKPEGWSKIRNEDLCETCTGEFAEWRAQKSAEGRHERWTRSAPDRTT